MSEQKVEITNPLIWTAGLVGFGFFLGWWFSFMMNEGRNHGLQNPIQAQAPAGPKGPDQMALIKGLDEAALAKGEQVYTASCMSCHGKDGHLALGGARKFGLESFQNTKYGAGASPLSMYLTLEKGWNGGAMPPQNFLTSEDRYAVIHYIRETFIKGSDQYRPLDEAYLTELTKVAPGQSVEAEVLEVPGQDYPHPADQPLTIPIYAVLAETAARPQPTSGLLGRATSLQVAPGLCEARDQLAALDATLPGAAIEATLAQGDAAAFARTLTGSAVLDQAPALAVLGADEVRALFDGLRSLRGTLVREEAH